MDKNNKYMDYAVELAQRGMDANEGGPFGCVIVREGEIIGEGFNRVLANHDPTAHAEIVAIRHACKHMGIFSLEGCELYTTCEPCPMCLSAIYWARIPTVYFAATRQDAAKIGFDDHVIYQELEKPMDQRSVAMHQMSRTGIEDVFTQWVAKKDKTLY